MAEKERPAERKSFRRLYLMRHGKAKKNGDDGRDVFRPLVKRGRKDVKKIRNLMIDRQVNPDLILCSPAVRTMETLMKLKKAFKSAEVVFVDALYMADAEEILRILRRTAPDKKEVLVIGHNPGLHDFLPMVCDWNTADEELHLHRIAERFPTSALACLEIPEPWQKLGNTPVRLKEFVYSSDL